MRNLFTKLKVPVFKRYDLFKLIDMRVKQPVNDAGHLLHIVCDIDKTYLETEFESFYKMAKIAFETPTAKKTVLGASDVLRAARWGGEQRGLSQ